MRAVSSCSSRRTHSPPARSVAGTAPSRCLGYPAQPDHAEAVSRSRAKRSFGWARRTLRRGGQSHGFAERLLTTPYPHPSSDRHISLSGPSRRPVGHREFVECDRLDPPDLDNPPNSVDDTGHPTSNCQDSSKTPCLRPYRDKRGMRPAATYQETAACSRNEANLSDCLPLPRQEESTQRQADW